MMTQTPKQKEKPHELFELIVSSDTFISETAYEKKPLGFTMYMRQCRDCRGVFRTPLKSRGRKLVCSHCQKKNGLLRKQSRLRVII